MPDGAIHLIHPANRAGNVSLIRQDYLEFVARRAEFYEQGDYNINNMDRHCFPEPVILQWSGGTPPFQIKFREKNHNHADIFHTGEYQIPVWNLKSNTNYAWSVRDQNNNRSPEFCFSTADSPRLIALPEREYGPVNFRDAGGWRSCFGGRVKQGMVYRGAGCDQFVPACPANIKFLREKLKIKTELDLRYPRDVAGINSSALGENVRWLHYPVNAYSAFIPEQNLLFRDTMRSFADPDLYPVFVHCNGGCDRTGEIIFLLNALLGVSDQDLLQDYELTSLSLFSRKCTIPYFVEWRNTISSFAESGMPYRISVEAYLRHLGITEEEIQKIRKNLLESPE